MTAFRHLLLLVAVFATFSQIAPAQGIMNVHVVDDHGQRIRPHRRPPRRWPITIDKHAVKVTVENGVATTTVTQVFRNPNRVILEGSYLFPIPEEASITDFTMVMNGKVVHGEVLEKEKARNIYEGIVRQTRDPALLEYVGRKTFRARVFPLPPRGTAEITLTYVEQLPFEGGIGEYRYPLKTQAFTTTPVGLVTVHATIKSSTAIKSVFSSSHEVDKTTKGENEVQVSFEGKQVAANRDFHLFYALSDADFGLHLLSQKSTRDGGYFMMTLAPKQEYSKDEIAPKDVVFVVDTSGSMRDDNKMDQAKAALKYGLRGLNAHDRFNIIGFATEARAYSERMIGVSKASIAEAVAWVDELRANGGTNIHDAMTRGLATLGSGERVRMIVFLTDGMPTVGNTQPKQILDATKKANAHGARVFVFGVGYDVNTQLLDALAEDNKGARDYVTPSQNLELELSRFFDKVSFPVLSDIQLVMAGPEMTELYPKQLPDLFKGSDVTVFGRYEKGDDLTITLRGNVGGKEKSYTFEGRLTNENTRRDFIPVLWAKRKIGYLWDQIRLNGKNEELKDEIVRLGKKFGIATPYTSFLVAEDGDVARLRDRSIRRRGRRPGTGGPGGGGGGRGGRHFGTTGGEALRLGAPGATTTINPPKPKSSADFFAFRAQTEEKRDKPADAADGKPSGRTAVRESLYAERLKKSQAGEKNAELDDLAFDADSAEGGDRRVVQRFGGKTFELRLGYWVDVSLDQMKAADRKKKSEEVEAFSARYFELLRVKPRLAKFVAKMPKVLVEIDGRIYWIKAPAEEKADPATPKEKEPTPPVRKR